MSGPHPAIDWPWIVGRYCSDLPVDETGAIDPQDLFHRMGEVIMDYNQKSMAGQVGGMSLRPTASDIECQSQVAREPEINKMLGRQGELLERLHGNLMKLHERLSPVLRSMPEPADDERKPVTERPINTKLGAALYQHCQHTEAMITLVEKIHVALEL